MCCLNIRREYCCWNSSTEIAAGAAERTLTWNVHWSYSIHPNLDARAHCGIGEGESEMSIIMNNVCDMQNVCLMRGIPMYLPPSFGKRVFDALQAFWHVTHENGNLRLLPVEGLFVWAIHRRHQRLNEHQHGCDTGRSVWRARGVVAIGHTLFRIGGFYGV